MNTLSPNRRAALLAPLVALALFVPTLLPAAPAPQVVYGQEIKLDGVLIKRGADTFTLLDTRGIEHVVTLTNLTQVKEKKKNFFREGKNYATTNLLRGLALEVKGRKDTAGTFYAEEIKFTDTALRMASTVDARVTPVEGQLKDTESRLSQAEQNQHRLSGQVEELSAISNSARGGAKAAQETADAAIAGVNTANERITTVNTTINSRISSLDDFDVKNTTTVNFKVGSHQLSQEAMGVLDMVAQEAKSEKGYVIEVSGYASADGPEEYNRRLSQQRADAVVRYLAENHTIPLRRIVTPFGYGEKQPLADNKTRDGRVQNRRVEIKILVNRGINEPGKLSTPTGF